MRAYIRMLPVTSFRDFLRINTSNGASSRAHSRPTNMMDDMWDWSTPLFGKRDNYFDEPGYNSDPGRGLEAQCCCCVNVQCSLYSAIFILQEFVLLVKICRHFRHFMALFIP